MPRLTDTVLREIDTYLSRDLSLTPATARRWRQRVLEIDAVLQSLPATVAPPEPAAKPVDDKRGGRR